MTTNSVRLKDQFDTPVIVRLSGEIAAVYVAFDKKDFERDARRGFDDLELLERGRHIARVLHEHLPASFDDAIAIILATLPAHQTPEGGMASFYYLPHTEFVRQYGLAHWEPSMRALHALTQRFTGEFAIRPFLEQHTEATLERLHEWARDPSEHVRRLVSEGTRPRLPWAPRLKVFQDNPSSVVALLEKLKDDESLYVRRSVANHLNDIGKDHPQLLVKLTTRWMKNASAERRWIVQQALRSLVRAGDTAALKVLGYGDGSSLTVVEQQIAPSRVKIGGKVAISVTLENPTRKTQRAVVDLVVHFVKAKRASTGAKVFKLSNVELAAGESVTLRKTVSLAQLTTRKHYAGTHRVELQINGQAQPLGTFVLAR